MPQKIPRVQRLEQRFEPLRSQIAYHERGETRHGAGIEQRVPAEIVVKAETQPRTPGIFESGASALDAATYQRAILFGGTGELRYLEQGLVGRNQDAAQEDVLDHKWVRVVDGLFIAAGALYKFDEPEVASVLGVRRTF